MVKKFNDYVHIHLSETTSKQEEKRFKKLRTRLRQRRNKLIELQFNPWLSLVGGIDL